MISKLLQILGKLEGIVPDSPVLKHGINGNHQFDPRPCSSKLLVSPIYLGFESSSANRISI